MPDKIASEMFAPCGMNCQVCYKHLSEKKACKGCLNNDENKPEHCRKCLIKECAKEKGNQYCLACSDYPCQRIKNLDKSYIKRYNVSIIQNSTKFKDVGVECFMEYERVRWTCSQCKGIVSLHDATCSECHAPAEKKQSTPYD